MTTLGAGWASFGQVFPPGMATDGLRLGDLETQTDVDHCGCRWPDGSIKFAVVTAHIPADGDYPLTAFSPPADVPPFPPTPRPAFWLALKIGSTWYSVGYYPTPQDSVWLDGPLCRERRFYGKPVPFFTNTGATHPFLRAVLDVREYHDGTWRFDCCVENCVKGAGFDIAYSVYAGVDANTKLWSKLNHRHKAGTRWRKVWWLQGGVFPTGAADFSALALSAPQSEAEVRVRHAPLAPLPVEAPSRITFDFAQHIAAKAIPHYSPAVENRINYVWGANFEIGGIGDLDPHMESHSGREELAPYPNWTARYLVHKDPNLYDYVLAHGDLAGSWPIHARGADGRMVTIDDYPQFWMDDRWRTDGLDGPAWGLGTDLTPDVNHQPSLAYIPYILTGDRYYADELAAWANYCLLWVYPEARGPQGYLYSLEPRGVGWGTARLAEAAGWLPDADQLKAYFAEKLVNNLQWYDGLAADAVGYNLVSAYGVTWMGVNNPPEGYEGPLQWCKDWQHDVICWAIDLANQFGFPGGEAWRNQIARFRVGWLTDPQYRDGACPYGLVVQLRAGGPGLSQYWQAYGYGMGPVQFSGYYGSNGWITASVGKRNGVPGSQEALDYLLAVEPEMSDYLSQASGWFFSL